MNLKRNRDIFVYFDKQANNFASTDSLYVFASLLF